MYGMREKEESRNGSKVYGLSNWKSEVAPDWNGEECGRSKPWEKDQYVKFEMLNRWQERGVRRRHAFSYHQHVFNTEYQEVETDYQTRSVDCKGKVSEEWNLGHPNVERWEDEEKLLKEMDLESSEK